MDLVRAAEQGQLEEGRVCVCGGGGVLPETNTGKRLRKPSGQEAPGWMGVGWGWTLCILFYPLGFEPHEGIAYSKQVELRFKKSQTGRA